MPGTTSASGWVGDEAKRVLSAVLGGYHEAHAVRAAAGETLRWRS
jgi:hypothetical protein